MNSLPELTGFGLSSCKCFYSNILAELVNSTNKLQ